MQCVHAISVDESRKIRRAPDAADGDHIVIGNLQLYQGLLDGRQHSEVAATGTPVGIDLAFQIGYRELRCSLYASGHVSSPP